MKEDPEEEEEVEKEDPEEDEEEEKEGPEEEEEEEKEDPEVEEEEKEDPEEEEKEDPEEEEEDVEVETFLTPSPAHSTLKDGTDVGDRTDQTLIITSVQQSSEDIISSQSVDSTAEESTPAASETETIMQKLVRSVSVQVFG